MEAPPLRVHLHPMMAVPRIGLLFAALFLFTDCSRRAGSQATAGAISEFTEAVKETPEEEQGLIAERTSKALVRGALDELTTPERQAQLALVLENAMSQSLHSLVSPSARFPPASPGTGGGGVEAGAPGVVRPGGGPPLQRMGSQLGRGMTASASEELQRALGEDATGPLADALATSTERMSASAVAGVRAELRAVLGPCTAEDPRECLDRRVYELGRAASSGAVAGLKLPLLLLTFGFGFALALLLVHTLQHVGGRRAAAQRPLGDGAER